MREKIDVAEYAPTILRELPKGVLLTAQADGRANPMTIGWGTLGIEWGRQLFVAYVRSSRFTYGLLERSGEFTVSVPMFTGEKDHDQRVRQILAVCGSKSGRDQDKVAELGLTLVEGEQGRGARHQGAAAHAGVPRALQGPAGTRPSSRTTCAATTMPTMPRTTAYYAQIVSAYLLR